MLINDNGVIREMTDAEVAALEEFPDYDIEPTDTERIAELEAALVEVAEYAAEQEARNDMLEAALVELASLIGG